MNNILVGQEQGKDVFSFHLYSLEVLVNAVRQFQEVRCIQIAEEVEKPSLFADT
jgi:hypothetical protein